MKKQSPAPISTQVNSTGGNTNLPWVTWLREASDFLTSATKTQNLDSCEYTMIGQICFINVAVSTTTGTVKLPYTSIYTKKICAFIAGANTPVYFDLPAGSNIITVTPSVSIVISDWYVTKLD
jgi:hypothetical protein